MELKELVGKNENNLVSVLKIMVVIYPQEIDNEENYRQVFTQLTQKIKSLPENINKDYVIRAEYITEDELFKITGQKTPHFSPFYNVDGEKPDGSRVALDFEPWDNWLRSEINAEDLKILGEETILALILYEMTFVSFNEEEIALVIDQAEKDMQEYLDDPEAHSSSADDFLDQLLL